MEEQVIYKKGPGEEAGNGALQQAADILLKKVRNQLESTETDDLTPQAAKHYSSVLKDIRDLQSEAAGVPKIVVKIAEELEELSQ